MPTVSIREAKARMDELIDDVLAGKEVIITCRSEPLAALVPVEGNSGTVDSSVASA